MDIGDIKYLAGLLEGEGSFQLNQTPVIKLQMTDEDIVTKAKDLMSPNSKVNVEYPNKENRKPVYGFNICSTKAIEWMFTLYPLMGIRRKAKIREIIAGWKKMPGIGNRKEYTEEEIFNNMVKQISINNKITIEEAKGMLLNTVWSTARPA